MNEEEKEALRTSINQELLNLEKDIDQLSEWIKPIPPDSAIGRLTRMDAINNRSVNEAVLRTAEKQKADLLRALERLNDHKFGLCHACGERIPIGRILLVPGATRCVSCSV